MAQYIRFPSGSATVSGSVSVNIHDSAGSNITNGQQTMANSVPVVIASNQTAVPVSAASLPLPSGAATEATLSTLNGKVTACNTGAVVVSSSALPTGAATEATLSTVNGKFGTLGQKTMAGSAPVVLASDQAAIPVSQSGTWTVQPGNTANTTPWLATINQGGNSAAVSASNALKVDGSAVTQPVSIAATVNTREAANANGSIVNTSLTATTASTANVPANAVGFVLEAPSTNTDNIRWCIGGTASTTVGMLAEPGRDSGYIPCAANISVCATVSGTNAFSIQWVLTS